MVLARRIDKLEEGLDPEAAVLRWMHEAHRYPTLEAYTDACGGSGHPLETISAQVEGSVRSRLKGHDRRDTARSVRQAARAAAFRLQLVVMINLEGMDLLRVQGILYVAQVYRMRELCCRELLADGDDGEGDRDRLDRDWTTWADTSRQLVALLVAKRAALEDPEERYLGGHSALFPDTASALAELATAVDALVASVYELGVIDAAPVIADESSPADHAERLVDLAARAARL